ncbi:MAG: lysoplasmalogenase [Ilumatobacteraceae bacterium]
MSSSDGAQHRLAHAAPDAVIIEAVARESSGKRAAATPWCRVPLVALGVAAIDWVARSTSFAGLDNVAKPAAIATLAAWLLLALRRGPVRLAGGPVGWKPRWLVAALVASLAGDVLLIKPSTVAGGAAFLIAHVCYVVGFDRAWLIRLRSWFISAGVVTALAIPLVLMLGGTASLIYVGIPVYAGALALMVASAISIRTQRGVNRGAAAAVGIGAVMFAASDAMLLVDFGRGTEGLALPAIVVYHLGQLGIVAGMVNLGLRSSRLQFDVRPVPFGRSATATRSPMLAAAALATVALWVAFVVAGRTVGGVTPSLDRLGRQRSTHAVDAILAELDGQPRALTALRHALLIDLAFPFAYCALLVLVCLTAARSLSRDGSPLDGLARIAGWVFIGTFCFDHLENVFLWREVGGGARGWEVWATFAFHGLKWASIAIGLALLGAAGTNVGLVMYDRRARWRREPATADVGLAGID